MNMADLQIIYSGAAGNEDPDASLGGIISSAAGKRVLSQSHSGFAMAGVTGDYACGNALGAGTLHFDYAGTTLTWTPNGGTGGDAVDVSVDGVYVIADTTGDEQLHVTIVAASLPGSNDDDTITIANIANETFDDISKQESLDGDIEYRCFYLKNAHATDEMLNVTIWLKSDAVGADSLTLGADLAGVGDGVSTGVADTIANENTAPDPAVSFSAPSSRPTGIVLGTLAAGKCVAFWIKRTVPADTTTSTAIDLSIIGVAAYI